MSRFGKAKGSNKVSPERGKGHLNVKVLGKIVHSWSCCGFVQCWFSGGVFWCAHGLGRKQGAQGTSVTVWIWQHLRATGLGLAAVSCGFYSTNNSCLKATWIPFHCNPCPYKEQPSDVSRSESFSQWLLLYRNPKKGLPGSWRRLAPSWSAGNNRTQLLNSTQFISCTTKHFQAPIQH